MDRFSYVRTLRDAIYGKVILARRNASNHDELVAIKMMSLQHLAARTALRGNLHIKEDGLQEFAILQSLAPHASLLHLLEDFEHDNMLCLVFAYCPYGELFDQVHGPNKTSRGVHEAIAARWFRQIVLGVVHIHAGGVAHRDLSLENILLDAQQHCRICDFGLATQRGDLATGRVGKPFYMAPEVYLGDHTSYNGFTADVWSLGILLFILVCGMPPLEVPGDHDARFRIVRQEGIRALVKMWGLRLSERVLDLIAQLLRVQPHERSSLETILQHPWLAEVDACEATPAVDCRPPTTTTAEVDVMRCDGKRHGSCMAYVA
ncbi:CAMK protein kinase [Saprolegnia parasitica CBS 223.65]|uniref:CAMK protein kinase n=1 Tax=Saprolegnia parasitica (strain CBS 223.65) TaxID=695850 RepID=A0A067BQZ8_SAPPC|nr:CAMK protein kinase [Saprolegnia parasitica CBS 223.65]KDO20949.1 CAMK protein kinase [Saprolegnia parasitica CBS 223.65]|eukprot:XP_012208340.1 CAMK protein kinase [Saprolegnia parasitica CBS 223.65]